MKLASSIALAVILAACGGGGSADSQPVAVAPPVPGTLGPPAEVVVPAPMPAPAEPVAVAAPPQPATLLPPATVDPPAPTPLEEGGYNDDGTLPPGHDCATMSCNLVADPQPPGPTIDVSGG